MNKYQIGRQPKPKAANRYDFPGKPNQPIDRNVTRTLPPTATIDYTGKRIKQQHLINIDSRNRDILKYPNSNSFRYPLKSTFKQVKSIELVTAEIPNTDFLVNEFNYKFDFEELGTVYPVELQLGDFGPTSLAAHITDRMNNVGAPSTYTVTFCNGLLQFTSSINEFKLLFKTGASADTIKTSKEGYNNSYVDYSRNSSRKLMGFDIADYISSSQVLRAPNKIDLAGEPYIILELGDKTKGELDFYSSDFCEAFAKIVLAECPNEIVTYKEHDYEIRREYNTNDRKGGTDHLQKLNALDVRFRRRDGNLYNFRGHEPSFMLRIITLE